VPATSRRAGRGSTPKSSARSHAPRTFLYLYCVVEPSAEAEALLRTGAIEGLDPAQPLFPIMAEGLMAAVSHVPAKKFNEDALNKLVTDLTRLAPFVVRHENAVRTLSEAAAAVVPMTFGAVYREPDGVLQFLATEARRLQSLLDAVRGQQEWGIKVFADPAKLRDAAEQSSPALRALDAEIEAAGPGKAYLLQRKRDEMLAAATRDLLRTALRDLLEGIEGECTASRLEDIPSDQAGPTELVLKAAFLVEKGDAARFQSRVDGLTRSLVQHGLSVELTGPWAAYSFTGATLNGG